jgi:hypothetical protein
MSGFVIQWLVPASRAPVQWIAPAGAIEVVKRNPMAPVAGLVVPPGSAGAGDKGDPGDDGLSAYEVALDNGFVGTEATWLASLVGPKGDDGDLGPAGEDGLSAYQLAVAGGFVGDQAAWLASLKGDKGDKGDAGDRGPAGDDGGPGLSAYQVAVAAGFAGTQSQWLASLVGPKGDKGDDGDAGPQGDDGGPGPSAYQIAVAGGFAGDEAAWLAALVGPKGDKGDDGDAGPQGPAGPATAHLIAPGLAAGTFITNALNATAQGTISQAANRIEFIPFWPSRDITVDLLSIEVTGTLVAGSQARIGIYGSTAGNLPGDLLTGAGSLLDCATAGAKQSPITGGITLTAGTKYWLAVHASSTQTLRGLAVAALLPLGLPETGTTINTARRATVTFASGLPTTAPATTLISAIAPRVALRLA